MKISVKEAIQSGNVMILEKEIRKRVSEMDSTWCFEDVIKLSKEVTALAIVAEELTAE